LNKEKKFKKIKSSPSQTGSAGEFTAKDPRLRRTTSASDCRGKNGHGIPVLDKETGGMPGGGNLEGKTSVRKKVREKGNGTENKAIYRGRKLSLALDSGGVQNIRFLV